MVGTRSSIEESQRRFRSILTDIFGLDIQAPIYQAFSQEMIYTLSDLASLQDKDIDDMTYVTTIEIEGQITTSANPLTKGNKGWIKALIAFIKYLDMDSEEDFENVDNNQFSTFRLSIYNPNSTQQTSSSTSTRLRNSHNKRGHTDAVVNFKKSIKRDKTQYGILKEDKQWDSWNRSTKAAAC